MSFNLTAIAIALMAISGVPGLFMPSGFAWGQRVSVLLTCAGSLLGLLGVVFSLFYPDSSLYILSGTPIGATLVGLDALSAFFLVPVYVVGALATVYGVGYWAQQKQRRTARKVQFFLGTMLAGMALLVISKQALAFLLGWEVMALSAFFLVAAEDDKEETRKSAFVYIVATHVCTLSLFGLFALWRSATGSFLLVPIFPGAVSLRDMNILFVLMFFGFGMKAGVMPLHFWLPGAHANAPSHISALLSGVMLKMGIYGLIRMLSLLPNPPAFWGWWILCSGMTSGLLGVVFALAQHDLKKLLAYHSVENIGIILLGLGVAMLGLSYHHPSWIMLGMAGCLLHVWNHSLFKALLFLGAGSVMHGTHTRQIDLMGALARRMPWTAGLFLVGAVAICGLPPLNGFISEFFVYIGLFRMLVDSSQASMLAVFASPVLAMIGALAVACFVKVYGTVFLGLSRTRSASLAHESPVSMIIPMAVLALLCLCIGLAPTLIMPFLEKAISVWLPGGTAVFAYPQVSTLVPLGTLGIISPIFLAAVLALVFWVFLNGRTRRTVGTWDCGYARPTARMQYSATSFARPLVGLFDWVLRTKTHGPEIQGNFPLPGSLNSHIDEAVLDRGLIPFSRYIKSRFSWWRRFQQGQTQYYFFYILIALTVMLLTLLPYSKIAVVIFK